MWSWLRRLCLLALVTAAGYAAYVAWQRKRPDVATDLAADPPQWPPFEPAPSADATRPERTTPSWLPPVDGECPEGYPVKVNVKSGIYHVPSGRFYARTVPERCYLNEATAEADGYRRAKA